VVAAELAKESAAASGSKLTTASQWDEIDAMGGTGSSEPGAPDEWAESDGEHESKPVDHAAFESARKAHYAEEVKKMRELMRKGAMKDDDGEEEDDGDI
jgi:predicted lipid-binding transport protein (Tim44 family)